jgi:hypothetical protein
LHPLDFNKWFPLFHFWFLHFHTSQRDRSLSEKSSCWSPRHGFIDKHVEIVEVKAW